MTTRLPSTTIQLPALLGQIDGQQLQGMEPSAVLHIDGGQLTAGDKAGGVAHAPPDLWKVEPKDYLTENLDAKGDLPKET